MWSHNVKLDKDIWKKKEFQCRAITFRSKNAFRVKNCKQGLSLSILKTRIEWSGFMQQQHLPMLGRFRANWFWKKQFWWRINKVFLSFTVTYCNPVEFHSNINVCMYISAIYKFQANSLWKSLRFLESHWYWNSLVSGFVDAIAYDAHQSSSWVWKSVWISYIRNEPVGARNEFVLLFLNKIF